MVLFLDETQVDPSNYTDFATNCFTIYFTMIDYSLTKFVSVFLKEVITKNDNGWLFPNESTAPFISVAHIYSDSYKTKNDGVIYSCTINFGKTKEIFERTYVKIQSVFADTLSVTQLVSTFMSLVI